MITTNYHTHTYRCGHAVGSDEEYVLAALQAGLKTLGFSDHAPYHLPDPGHRMDLSQFDEYVSSIRALKEKYKDVIDIYVGLELECYKSEWETLSMFRETLDYCILGQHGFELEGKRVYRDITEENLMHYVDLLEYACEHSLCDCIAHPDVILWMYPKIDEAVKKMARRIAELSIKYNMPLELNCGSGAVRGYRLFEDGYRLGYPDRTCFEIFSEYQCPIIIGIDAHNPQWFLTDEYLNRSLSVVEGLNLNILNDYDLIQDAKERKKKFY